MKIRFNTMCPLFDKISSIWLTFIHKLLLKSLVEDVNL